MNAIVSVDELGRLTLPEMVRDRLHLHKDSRLDLSVTGDRIELRLLSDAVDPSNDDEGEITYVLKDGIPVLVGLIEPVDAVAIIKADREERDEKIARLVRFGPQ